MIISPRVGLKYALWWWLESVYFWSSVKISGGIMGQEWCFWLFMWVIDSNFVFWSSLQGIVPKAFYRIAPMKVHYDILFRKLGHFFLDVLRFFKCSLVFILIIKSCIIYHKFYLIQCCFFFCHTLLIINSQSFSKKQKRNNLY